VGRHRARARRPLWCYAKDLEGSHNVGDTTRRARDMNCADQSMDNNFAGVDSKGRLRTGTHEVDGLRFVRVGDDQEQDTNSVRFFADPETGYDELRVKSLNAHFAGGALLVLQLRQVARSETDRLASRKPIQEFN
jgi:hypothetical protein